MSIRGGTSEVQVTSVPQVSFQSSGSGRPAFVFVHGFG